MTPPPLPASAALFLDFDGCLVDIAPRPDAVQVTPALTHRLTRLMQRQGGAVALISGRDVADLRRHLPDFPGIVAGSHGAEFSPGPGRIQAARHPDLDIARLHQEARALARPHPAVLVEEKPHGVALHYRADPALRAFVEDVSQRLAEAHPGLALQPAKMAVELRPAGIGKGDALARLMKMPAFAGRIPVYAGDDTTDEPAMAKAQELGGFAVKIGSGASVARYTLPDPEALAAWLDDSFSRELS
ncbi:trehalose-phosphatase [Paracoccus bogoriensis]|uniref:trehalose-phosphatase n=1 Tax=Paracoccus bogoriensis TaxID=242065 RepID=UPI001CA587DE|nr:trehalose-phosphatase [Paracoccus bogoriensis]MBW7057043.1 trehalose-phosphatase [Paracoccus bogoriensis]